ncbi:hypothetical protein [Pseudoduganella lutea]|uniref:DUF3304 domain-containing protein n=1 Tax=Pseudoduganella lutea TaxID=321985 RepID=A0A4P6KV91_9BURK|nr:hypothetical protein [Pseudoduganella lutea]QBE62766.1 hypothetical protein EWM63_07120 [Pseudoduganella lutea]
MKTPLCLSLMCFALLSGCSMMRNQNDPVRAGQTVSVINAITWTNPLSGKRDGVRTTWPLAQLAGHEENFPLAQIKNCREGATPCAWGVLSTSRNITRYDFVAGGVALDLAVTVDVHRRQQDRRRNFHTSMAIPTDVPALQYRKVVQQGVALPYGKVHRLEFEHGVKFEICAQRLDKNGRALDDCNIPYI